MRLQQVIVGHFTPKWLGDWNRPIVAAHVECKYGSQQEACCWCLNSARAALLTTFQSEGEQPPLLGALHRPVGRRPLRFR